MAHELLHKIGSSTRGLPADAVCEASWFRSCSQREKREEGKMETLVTVPVDDARFEVLERRYQT